MSLSPILPIVSSIVGFSLRFLFFVIFIWILFSSTAIAQSPITDSEEITIVKVGVHDAWPLVFNDGDNGYVGFVIDILNEIAATRGWELQYVPGNWAELRQMLVNHEIDLLFPYSNKPSTAFDKITTPLAMAWGGLFVQSGSHIGSIFLIEGKTVAALEGDLFGNRFKDLVESLGINLNFILAASTEEVFALVRDGRADGAVVEWIDGSHRAKKYGLHATTIRFSYLTAHFGVAKDRHPNLVEILDTELSTLKANSDSEFYRSYNRWYGDLLKAKQPRWVRPVIYFGLGATIFLLCSLLYSRYKYLLLHGKAVSLSSEFDQQKLKYVALQEDFQKQIGSLKSTGDRMRQSKKMEAIGQLTGSVAHDFNNILGVVIGNLDLAKDRYQKESSIEEFLDRATAAAMRGSQLTKRLLSFSRLQPIAPVRINVVNTLNQMMDLISSTLGDAITITVEVDQTVCQTNVDPSQLETAILNLALNARDAMPAGGDLMIYLTITKIDQQTEDNPGLRIGRYIELSFSDTGIGFTEEEAEKAIEPFYTSKPLGKGSGLGLSIVYGFVQQSGGFMTINGEHGKGAKISLFLPQVLDGSVPSQEKIIYANGLVRGSGEKILVIEDDHDFRRIVTLMLTDLGYTYIEAGCGSTALELASGSTIIDLVLSDVELPGGLNGVEATGKILIMRPNIPVVFMTAHSEDIDHLSSSGSNVIVIKKPFNKQTLAATLHSAYEGRPHHGHTTGGLQIVKPH